MVRKSFFLISLSVILLLSMIGSYTTAQAKFHPYYAHVRETVYVHQYTSHQSRNYGLFVRNESIVVYGFKNGWVLTHIINHYGYVPSSSVANGRPGIWHTGYTTHYVNLYSPFNGKKLRTLNVGTHLNVYSQEGSTLTVNYGGDYGQIWSHYVRIIYPKRPPAKVVLYEPTVRQYPQLPRGCEVSSLSILLKSARINVDKMRLAAQVTKVPYYSRGKMGNPYYGFVGNMYTFSRPGLGVYHGPIYSLARRYLGRRAIDLTGSSWSRVEAQIVEKRPVWVITSFTLRPVPSYQWEWWYTAHGRIRVTSNEHSVLVTGYDKYYVYINNPANGARNQKVLKSSFVSAWNSFGHQAISYN